MSTFYCFFSFLFLSFCFDLNVSLDDGNPEAPLSIGKCTEYLLSTLYLLTQATAPWVPSVLQDISRLSALYQLRLKRQGINRPSIKIFQTSRKCGFARIHRGLQGGDVEH